MSAEYKFTVPGHPVPYLRMTVGQTRLMKAKYHRLSPKLQKVYDQVKRYLDYKDAVAMIASVHKFDRSPKAKVHMTVKAYFKNNIRGDMDNIFKAIADAVYQNDKNLVGSFDYEFDTTCPRVECTITEP